MNSQSKGRSLREQELLRVRSRIMQHRLSVSPRDDGRDFGTNNRTDGCANKQKADWLMGEGIGNNLGLDGPKYTRSYTPGELERMELENKEYQKEVRAKRNSRKRILRQITKAFTLRIPQKIEDGSLLLGSRIFLLQYTNKNWEQRMHKIGGMPDGVDIARSEFGHLVMVPVVESEQGGMSDPYGRRFFVSPETRQEVSHIFGAVDWKRPLTLREVEQFGVTVD